MTETPEFGGFIRFSLAFVLMTVTTTILYTIVSFGWPIAVPYLIVVFATAFVLAVLVFIPIMAICFKLHRARISWVAALMFLAMSMIIASCDLYAYSVAQAIFEQGEALVADGIITADGYFKVLRDSMVTGLISVFGSVVFWVIAFRRQRSQNG